MSSKQGRFAFLVTLASVTIAGRASAQIDTSPPLQDVLLLVDTSGSMEFASDGSKITCDQVDASLTGETKGPSQKSRWTQLIEVLTGDVQDYSCYTQDRRSTAFRNEYQLGTADAVDFNYHVPYHRILSGTTAPCTVGAGTADPNAFAWGSKPFGYHVWNNTATACAGLSQSQTGVLDSYRDRMRFGLMTFDTSGDAGTGLSGQTTPDYGSGTFGTWSYFLKWRTTPDCTANTNCAKGRPAGCSASTPMEVGARNAAAPPWEGRMIPFGSPLAAINDVRTTNDHIQQVLTSIRPFGATPINGLLNDARTFYRDDDDDDYTTAGSTCDQTTGIGCFGPKFDILNKNNCRKNYIILLTDGEPNLDLRPFCEGTSGGFDGICPYKDKSFEIVADLANSPTNPIKTYVIGFAVSNVTSSGLPTPVDCSKISSPGNGSTTTGTFDPQGLCDPATMKPELSACCTLAKIAFYGGTTNAFFATTASELRAAMSSILRGIGQTTSTRTLPVFASATSGSGGTYGFFSSFESDPSAVWSGVLVRQRTTCQQDQQTKMQVATDIPVDADQGDFFSDNVNTADASHPRHFFTFIPDADTTGKVWSDRSIRPAIALTNPDGITAQTGTPTDGTTADFFAPKVPATAMQVQQTACTDLPVPANADACATMFMKWEMAINNDPYQTRTNAFGAIYHSTPALLTAPSEFLRDESYTTFSDLMFKRPPVLFTATTDGQLHAFKVDASANDPNDTFTIKKKVNNELWSFLPPAVLPRIPSQYPDAEQVLLDGAPVLKDVVFARSIGDAQNGGPGAQWHSVLVAGFGGGGTGYFALDVTKPVVDAGDPTSGPKMLWQLTTDSAGNRLFGKRSGTPAIATLFFADPNNPGSAPVEYAVALLPGGESDGPVAGQCDQQGTPAGEQSLVDGTWPPRTKVQCFNNDPARSLTVVRLDTGEIIRSFRPQADGPASVLGRSVDASNKYAALNAPISGTPVVFPATTGAVSDRGFVGDQDGMLWRMDFSDTDPRNWKIKLFFDAYSKQAYNAGQPIATTPILSVDLVGNVTIAFSTGDQETFLATTGMMNFLWSLKEMSTTTPPFQSLANWYSIFKDGKRVSGPMSLFASNLFYTTYTPPNTSDPTQKCSNGTSSVCGVDYIRPLPGDGNGGAVSTPPITTDGTQCIDFGSAVIFGAGITQKPTCSSDVSTNDPYLGYGAHTGLADFTSGKFQLVMQTGPSSAGSTGAGSTGPINTRAVDLAPPMSPARIDSWAAVVE
jgi:type IV pilus assembly protein PilY1